MKKITKLLLTIAMLFSIVPFNTVGAENNNIGTFVAATGMTIDTGREFGNDFRFPNLIIKKGEDTYNPTEEEKKIIFSLAGEQQGYSVLISVGSEVENGDYSFSFGETENTTTGIISVVSPTDKGSFNLNQGANKALYETGNENLSNFIIKDSNGKKVEDGKINIYTRCDEDNNKNKHYYISAEIDSSVAAGKYTFLLKNGNDIESGELNINAPEQYTIFGTESKPTNIYVNNFNSFDLGFECEDEINFSSVLIYNTNDSNKKNVYDFQSGDNDIVVNLEGNCYTIYTSLDAELGKYFVSFEDSNANKYSGYINIVTSYTKYNGKKVIVGMGDSGEGGSIHIQVGNGSQVDQNDTGFGFNISAAYVDEDGNITGIVEQKFMDKLVDIKLSYDKNFIKITKETIPTEYKQAYKDVNGDDIYFDEYSGEFIGEIKDNSETKYIEATYYFDLDGDGIGETVLYNYRFVSTIILKECSINVSSLKEINDILASKEALSTKIKDVLKEDVNLEDDNYIYHVYLNLAAGEYTGTITSQITGYSNVQAFILASGSKYEYCDSRYEEKEIRVYDESIVNTVKITGGIENHGGIGGVRGIDFVAPIGDDDAIGIHIIGEKLSGNDLYMSYAAADMDFIYNCTFTGYDYAIKDEGNAYVSGIEYCKFENNNTAVYIDSNFQNHGSDSLYNTFVNNGISIDIRQLPESTVPYQYVFRNNYFFNNNDGYVDYNFSNKLSGTFFFYDCYYGEDYTVGAKNDNVRSTKIINSGEAKLVTSPCIMYPENKIKYGLDIDGDGTNAFINGTTYSLNTSNIDKNTELEIEVCDSEGITNAIIIFGGNN